MSPPVITVLAGVNGAGKSSVVGAALRATGADYHDPDEVTRAYRAHGIPEEEANVRAWNRGRQDLARAIDEGRSYAFETTLGGRTMTDLLIRAGRTGIVIRMIYVGLASADLHVERVRGRVARGGHAIPEERIRHRWVTSRKNLIRLLPRLMDLRVYDNSAEANPEENQAPEPKLLLEIHDRVIRFAASPEEIPDWAKPVLMAAAKV